MQSATDAELLLLPATYGPDTMKKGPATNRLQEFIQQCCGNVPDIGAILTYEHDRSDPMLMKCHARLRTATLPRLREKLSSYYTRISATGTGTNATESKQAAAFALLAGIKNEIARRPKGGSALSYGPELPSLSSSASHNGSGAATSPSHVSMPYARCSCNDTPPGWCPLHSPPDRVHLTPLDCMLHARSMEMAAQRKEKEPTLVEIKTRLFGIQMELTAVLNELERIEQKK